MTTTIGLISYGESANLFNVKKALERAGAKVIPVEKKSDFSKIDKIVFPGVGSFKDAMSHLDKNAISGPLTDAMVENPALGICLGMQILARVGYEFGETKGLGVIDAEVKRMEVHGKVPHLGWGSLLPVQPCQILEGITGKDSFYFMHSYEMINFTEVSALSRYCDHTFVSVVQKGGIFGVQFHPEKSRESGLKLLTNFVNLGEE
jgi:imidazole glycerol phosphate synthase glutamine amidotransferase subunit